MTRKAKLAVMREMGRVGGKRRVATMSLQQRRELARKASLARWQRARPGRSGSFVQELRWLQDHRQQYLGQWVALDGDRLIAFGPSAREVYQAARRAGVKIPFIEHVQPVSKALFGGW